MNQKTFRATRIPPMKLREFADAVGVHIITAHRYERGAVPNPRTMRRILKLFPEISADDYHQQRDLAS